MRTLTHFLTLAYICLVYKGFEIRYLNVCSASSWQHALTITTREIGSPAVVIGLENCGGLLFCKLLRGCATYRL
jgi:hypothetical protein